MLWWTCVLQWRARYWEQIRDRWFDLRIAKSIRVVFCFYSQLLSLSLFVFHTPISWNKSTVNIKSYFALPVRSRMSRFALNVEVWKRLWWGNRKSNRPPDVILNRSVCGHALNDACFKWLLYETKKGLKKPFILNNWYVLIFKKNASLFNSLALFPEGLKEQFSSSPLLTPMGPASFFTMNFDIVCHVENHISV